MTVSLPNRNEVIAASAAAILIYAGFSIYVVAVTADASLTGDVIGTWKSFAVLAFGFWLGSSSGGKSKDGPPTPETVKDAATDVAAAAQGRADEIGEMK
ncbi:MAG TPA: hypothetical protein VF638_14370 [Sphingomonas sp.]|jgi:hypothetical protein